MTPVKHKLNFFCYKVSVCKRCPCHFSLLNRNPNYGEIYFLSYTSFCCLKLSQDYLYVYSVALVISRGGKLCLAMVSVPIDAVEFTYFTLHLFKNSVSRNSYHGSDMG